MRRRTFLLSSLAVPVFARASMAASGFASSPESDRRDMRRPATLFLLDPRVPEAHTVARAAVAAGASSFMLNPDVTDIWQHLDAAWRASNGHSPYAVAGVTAGNVLFVLERLARDHGLRTIYRGLHTRGEDGGFSHQIHGTAVVQGPARGPHAPHWDDLGRSLVEGAFVERRGAMVVASPTEPDPDTATFASWLLAPPSGGAGRA